tara:strand:+ start:390 stop:725 length:336 start_codon:yes stop_codon:yes gene_type:complete
MSFFNSDLVRSEMAEVQRLQEEIYQSVMRFPSMSKVEKLEHIGMLETLLDKQRILYTRMSLSDDPDAIKMKQQIIDQCEVMGIPKGTDVAVLFANLSKMLTSMRKEVDSTS